MVEGLATAVHRVLGLLRTRRGPLDSRTVRGALDQLRHFAHEAPDPVLRATVHVACAHLSAGDLEETHFALSVAAQALRLPPPTRAL